MRRLLWITLAILMLTSCTLGDEDETILIDGIAVNVETERTERTVEDEYSYSFDSDTTANGSTETTAELTETSTDITETSAEVTEITPEVTEATAEATETTAEITETTAEVTETTSEATETTVEVTETTVIESEPEETSPDVEYDYIINKKTGKIHLPACSGLPEEDNRRYVGEDEAKALLSTGEYTLCGTCRPQLDGYEAATESTVYTGSGELSGDYIVNKNNLKYHRTSCSRLPKEENRIYISAEELEELIKSGKYSPCQICKP